MIGKTAQAIHRILLALLLTGTTADAVLSEGFEGSFPPAGWTAVSVDPSSTYAMSGTTSAKLGAAGDSLITPAITNASTFIFWSRTTAADPAIIVEHAAAPAGPWTEFAESPFSGDTEQWNGRWVELTSAEPTYIRLRKSGTGTLYIDDILTETATNAPPQPPPAPTGAPWNVIFNEPQQSYSATAWPNQFTIRDALVDRINALSSGDAATLATFTFSADDGAGTVLNAIAAALDRGAAIAFIADNEANTDIQYGGTHSLRSLSTRSANPMTLIVDDDAGGIMHNKLGLFDYGDTNQLVFIASWNITLAASASQWNIALEARSPELYSAYKTEADELLAGRFHDDPAKSHAHDGSTFDLAGSWGTNTVRFAPYPADDNAELDIIAQIDQAQNTIVFALNKFTREPIRDALLAAAGRGVEIRGVMPRSNTDPGGVSADIFASLTNAVTFLPAFANASYTALDSGQPDLIHAKYMVIDAGTSNAVVIHGSANWTGNALVNEDDNDENLVILRHCGIARAFQTHFERITSSGGFSEGNSTLAVWNFDDGDRIADGGIDANATQTIARIPAPTSYSYSYDTLTCSGWQSGTNAWQTAIATTDHTDIKISSTQLASSTGPADFKLQFKTAADAAYTDVPDSTIHVPDGGNGSLTRIPLPDDCNNQPAVFLRWLQTSTTAANGGAIGSSGAGRIDNILITATAHNQPPMLAPLDNRTVFTDEPLSFTATASDPVDNDPIQLSAANLPPGAVFTNGTFRWTAAAPAGTYSITVTATDKDGSATQTVTLTVLEKPRLLLSEIADPADGGEFRFVELYNADNTAITLTNNAWFLSKQVNGERWYDIELTGTVAAASTWVVANSAPDFETAYGRAPDQESITISGNGNDAYALFFGGNHETGILIDLYGETDTDGSGTVWDYEDSRAERTAAVQQPAATWTVAEWILTPNAETGSMTPGAHGPAPEFQSLKNPFIFLGDDLSLVVTAVNTVKTDIITLSADALPDGAAFPTATGTNTVSGTLNWPAPTAGVYTITFAAAGATRTTRKTITVTVSDRAEIDGWFHGWKPDTIVKLDNGHFWRNTGGVGTTLSTPLRNPDVTVTNRFGNRRMIIDGVLGTTTVEPIDVTESTLIGGFSGLHRDTLYELDDGTLWKQISFETDSASADPATAWRWTENGDTFMRFLDRDDAVLGTCNVQPLAVLTRSIVTNTFTGLHYANRYRLANGQEWMQISFENVRTNITAPSVLLWIDEPDTHLFARGAGRCTVVDPAADADGDHVTNAAELIAGTSIHDATDLFLITRTGHDPAGRAVLNWHAVPGRSYTIEWAPTLTTAFQTLETDVTPPWTATNPAPSGFYRIRVQRKE